MSHSLDFDELPPDDLPPESFEPASKSSPAVIVRRDSPPRAAEPRHETRIAPRQPSTVATRTPPHSIEAEEQLLSCCLLDGSDTLARCIEAHITPQAFYSHENRLLYEQILTVHKKSLPVDLAVVAEELNSAGNLEAVGGYVRLMKISALIPTTAQAGYFLEKVREMAQRRELIKWATASIEAAHGLDYNLDALLERVKGKFDDLEVQGTKPHDVFQLKRFDELNSQEPPCLVTGLLHRGEKLVLGGRSKSFKTWTLIDLALSVANGMNWWGLNTQKGRVLYLNFEVQEPFFRKRLVAVAKAKGASTDNLFSMNLRGHCAGAGVILPRIAHKIRGEKFDLILIDPIYKILAGRDENAAGDIGDVLNSVERLAVDTGAAVAFGSHFSKGNQAEKDSIDRIGGSGVFARDPDSILTLTAHEEDGAFTVDAVLRNFVPIEPFVLRWEFPLMQADGSLNPSDLKKRAGAKEKHSADDALRALGSEMLGNEEWKRATKMPDTTFRRKRDALLAAKKVEQVGNLYRVRTA